MSAETRELLIAERDADLAYRDNIIAIEWGVERELDDGSRIALVPSGHMLGACQVVREMPSGTRCGYSGDFSWPIDEIIAVEELVVDSTYGKVSSVREYTQDEAEARLLEIVCEKLRQGAVHVKAYRGTIERVLQVLSGNVAVPILGSARLVREVAVYQQRGVLAEGVETVDSAVGKDAVRGGSYVQLYSKGDRLEIGVGKGTCVTCSAYMVPREHPVVEYSDRAYRVALSNHADFTGVLAYVKATGARRVVTDNTRSHGVELARAINSLLDGVEAMPSTNRPVQW